MLKLASWLLLAVVGGVVPSGQEILTRVSNTTARRRAVTYTGTRQYTLHNLRFNKEATMTVKMVSRPGEGKQFTIVQRSGTGKLLDIIQKLMDTEAEASRPSRQGQYEIAPPNYEARVRRSQIISGRDCFVLELTPKSKSKYLIEGTAWVDKSTYGIVRLDGTTAASLSIWVGNPRVIDDFQQVRGIWLPVHTQAVSSTMLLGESRLEIRYTDHQVTQ